MTTLVESRFHWIPMLGFSASGLLEVGQVIDLEGRIDLQWRPNLCECDGGGEDYRGGTIQLFIALTWRECNAVPLLRPRKVRTERSKRSGPKVETKFERLLDSAQWLVALRDALCGITRALPFKGWARARYLAEIST